ncbi:MAG: TonB-dependent receptor [Algibacter sp.]
MKLKIITLFLCCFSLVSTWSQTISGTITDESTIPLPGVNIIVKGSSTGAVSDFDGGFSIKAKKGDILEFSYIGYKSQEITINSQTSLNIVLKEDTAELDEIVVIGYGTQKKESVLGSIGQVKGAELLETGTPNVTNALSGLSPGLLIVQESGEPGNDDGDIFIRGVANPLILVDGVEIVGGFANIDPRDVESISILKDGSATAVYGIRGANGVIIITTKRGKTGKPKVSFSSQYSVKTYPDTYDSLNAFDAESLRNVALYNDADFSNAFNSQEDLNHFRDGDLPFRYPDTNWIDFATEDYATSFNQTVSVRGGSDFVKYYASAGYLQEGDITASRQYFNYDPEFKFKRYSFRGNLDFKLSKTTRLRTSISSRIEDRNKSGTGEDNDRNDFLGYFTTAPGTIPFYPAEALVQYPDPFYPGLEEVRFPISTQIGNDLGGSSRRTNTVFNVDLELQQDLDFITEGLTASVKYNYVSNYTTTQTISYDSSLETRLDRYDLKRDGTWDSEEGPDYERPFDFNLNNEGTSGTNEISYFKTQLNYGRSFGKHNVSGTVLFSRNKRINGTQFPFFNEDYVSRLTYDFDSKYFLEVAGAYNGDETFARGQRFKFFPSIAGGINLAKLKFVNDVIPALNNFKVRGSYGETGNKSGLNGARWQYLSFLDYTSGNTDTRANQRFLFGEGETSEIDVIEIDQLGNLDLTWSTVIKKNIGVDFGFLNNKISGSVDFFREQREDLISRPTSATIPIYFGSVAALPFANLEASDRKGYELSLTYKNKTAGGFAYSINGFYGFYENRVTRSTADGPGTPEYTTVAGKPSGTTALLQTDGYFQNIDELLNYPTYVGDPGLGDLRYIDYNANGTVIGTSDEDMLRFDLPKAPKYSYSLRLNGSYKAWSFSALINGIEGHKGLANANLYYSLPGTAAAGRIDHLDYWTPNNPNAEFPAVHLGNGNPNTLVATTDRVVDLDYIKLRNVNIGYTFDMSDNKSGISALKVYVSGSNLITISDLGYADPEGNRPGAYPILRRFNLGLDITF